DQPFAAWPADPNELARLLNELLNFSRPDDAVADETMEWVRVQERPLVWPVGETPESVRVAVINPAAEPVVARFTWVGSDQVPIAVELDGRQLTRVSIDRPSTGLSSSATAAAPPVSRALRVQI